MIARLVARYALVICIGGFSQVCSAGNSIESGRDSNLPYEQIASFAKQLERELASRNARVAIVARTGRPPVELPVGVRYTHVAFAVLSSITLDDGSTESGYVMHNLYQYTEKPERSDLVVDHPVEFFSSVPVLRAGIVVPTPDMQQRILSILLGGKSRRLHNPHYSVIANPYNNERQNCTEYTLNVIQAAIYNRFDMSYIKKTLVDHFIQPVLSLDPLIIGLGVLSSPGITLGDHPGQVRTATFGSIAAHLQRYDLAESPVHLLPEWTQPGSVSAANPLPGSE